jgi:DNA-binding MarR family transcriptional regulator
LIHSDDPDLTQLQHFLTFRLARVQARLNAQAIRILKETSGIGLSQWRVLAMIGSDETGTARAAEIKRVTGFDKGMFSRTVRTLIAAGLVTSDTVEEDHRRQTLRLTGAGRALYERTLPVMRARQRRLREALDEEELTALFSALRKLEAEVDRQEAEK